MGVEEATTRARKEATLMQLANKIAIVTGGGTGIGAAIATTFAREGAKVTITGRRKETLAEVADEIAASGGHALAMPGSVTDEADVQRAVQATLATFGRVDVLVNNAGSLLHAGPLHETADEIWDGVLDVFLKSVFRFSRAVIPHMQRQGGGSIVNIGSVLGLKASLAFPVHPYAVAKAGVAMLTKTIAVHYAKDGIRCNCVAPAVTETPTDGITAKGCRGANGHGGSNTARSARQSRRRRASRPLPRVG